MCLKLFLRQNLVTATTDLVHHANTTYLGFEHGICKSMETEFFTNSSVSHDSSSGRLCITFPRLCFVLL